MAVQMTDTHLQEAAPLSKVQKANTDPEGQQYTQACQKHGPCYSKAIETKDQQTTPPHYFTCAMMQKLMIHCYYCMLHYWMRSSKTERNTWNENAITEVKL